MYIQDREKETLGAGLISVFATVALIQRPVAVTPPTLLTSTRMRIAQ